MQVYGQPMVITSDDGTESTSNVYDPCAYRCGIELDFITPGRPMRIRPAVCIPAER